MRQTIAYECEYCGKVYKEKGSCRSHENRCYFNPKTKSCASCAFNVFGEVKLNDDSYTNFRGCKVNVDVSASLQTKCEHYREAIRDEEFEIITNDQTDIVFDEDAAIDRYLKRFNLSAAK